MKKKKVLLLGNGINRIDNDYPWDQLMRDLLIYCRLDDAITTENKPFPLLYEELYLRWRDRGTLPELDLKQMIRLLLRNIRSNKLHKQVMNMDLDEILTTNYDYNLEATVPGGLRKSPYIPPVKGSKYSILRRRKSGNKIVWHIHGEAGAPGSILLGYEQYAGYLQTIRNYVISGQRYKDHEMTSLTRRLKAGNAEIQSWIDHFFLSDVYIVGLSMDFVEIHLWWILDFRARLMRDKRYRISNNIVFVYPAQDTEWIKPRIDLMCACGVSCMAVPVVDGDWKGMYRAILQFVDRG